MKKSLYVTIALVLCLLMLCTACGESKQSGADDITPPDNTPVTDPDTTPPDSTADDNIQPPEDNTDKVEYPTKTVAPYTLDAPWYADETTKINNREALNAYVSFLEYFGSVTALDLEKQTEMKFSTLSGYVGTSYFQLVDFGYDGRLELVLCGDDSRSSNGIVFYEDGRLYIARVEPRNMVGLKYNGLCRSSNGSTGESYVMYNFSSKDGVTVQTLATVFKDADSGEKSYFVSADFRNGRYEETETYKVSKEDYETFIKPIDDLLSASKKSRTSENIRADFTVPDREIPNPTINLEQSAATREPDRDEKQANREALRLYNRFLVDTWYAIDTDTGEKGSFYELKRYTDYFINYAALVDFGLDSSIEMVIVPTKISEPTSVVFYENGEIYIDYIECNEIQSLTYDGLCRTSSGNIDRLSFTAESGCVRQTVLSRTADSATGEETYFSHTESREITKSEYESFLPQQTYPVFYDDESKYSMLTVESTADKLPDEATIEANREVLQKYYDFISGACTALDEDADAQVMFDSITRYGTNKVRHFGLVDFGSDGVLEMVLNDTGYHYYTVLYYMNGQVYTDGYAYRTFSWPTYTGIATGSGGSAGSEFMVTYTDEGRREWTFMSYALDREIYKDRYYISAAYENGRLVPAETVEVDKYTYYSFLENEPSVQSYTFDDKTLKEVLRVDAVSAPPSTDGGDDAAFDAEAQNAQALQAYYEWLTGQRQATDISKPNVKRTRTDMAALNIRYSRFAFADLGSDGVTELVLEYESVPSNRLVLYYEGGNLYYDTFARDIKANGYYEEETTWGGVRLLHHYITRYAPSRGEYTIELGYETPPSKDSPNPVYRLYYTFADGEYSLYTGESTKDALYSVLKEHFNAPELVWHTMDKMPEHELFRDIAGTK